MTENLGRRALLGGAAAGAGALAAALFLRGTATAAAAGAGHRPRVRPGADVAQADDWPTLRDRRVPREF